MEKPEKRKCINSPCFATVVCVSAEYAKCVRERRNRKSPELDVVSFLFSFISSELQQRFQFNGEPYRNRFPEL